MLGRKALCRYLGVRYWYQTSITKVSVATDSCRFSKPKDTYRIGAL